MPNIASHTAGNPELASAALASHVNFRNKPDTERLAYTRPRYASYDAGYRGTHAYIKLLGNSTTRQEAPTNKQVISSVYEDSMKILSSGPDTGSGYDQFIVTDVSSSIDEKVQVTEVFGDTEVAYYFGRAPVMVTVSGMLPDSIDNGWFVNWLSNYESTFRGSRLAQNHQQLQLILPSMTITGAMTNFGWEQHSNNDVHVGFRFTMLVTTLVPTPVVTINSSMSSASRYIDFNAVPGFSNQSTVNQLKNAAAVLKNPGSTLAQKAAALSGINSASESTDGLFSSVPGSLSEVAKGIDSMTSDVNKWMSDLTGKDGPFASITTALSSIRGNLFKPIYGVMNSLAKLVGAVFGGSGISGVLKSLTAPIRNILGDITRIANQATAITNSVKLGLASLGRGVSGGFGVSQAYQQAILAVTKAAGTIATLPGSVSTNIQTLFNSGHISPQAAFLRSNPKASLSRTPAFLHLSAAHAKAVSPQLSILSRKSTPPQGAYI
jgi:hypothetical protein